jgi:Tol biopolymer transport system component
VQRLSAALADRYVIERELGAGGMATVYLAHDVRHDRKVALKVLRPELSAILGAERFLHEIKTTANLQHPHILSLFDSGEADGLVYYVMPYVEGESLRDRLTREKQLPVDDAVRIAREVADALEYAHQHGIVHRDIKPENILLHGGHAQVADFGIALAASRSEGGSRMTETGMSLGTPHYMSPEQSMGEREITPKADIYALGCVLYEMLTAEPPFVGATAQAIIARVMTEEPRSLTLQRRTIPPHVEAAVMTALAKLPADRFATAAQFGDALGRTDYALPATRMSAASRTAARPTAGQRIMGVLPWFLLALGAGIVVWRWPRPAPVQVSRQQIAWPGAIQGGVVGVGLAIAPDGATLVYVDTTGGTQHLVAKERDRLESTPLAGTNGAAGPVFSPDGQWIAFVADGKVKKVPRLGGSAVTIADSANGALPALAWLDDGTVVFNNMAYDLLAVPERGGRPRRIFSVSTGRGIVTATPLPRGRGVLVGACTLGCPQVDLRVIDLRTDSNRILADDVYKAWHTPGGRVVFVRRDGGVFAAPFDLDSLAFTSAPAPVFEGVRTFIGGADMALSQSGTLIYVAGGALGGRATVEPVWVTRRGEATVVDSGWSFTPASNSGLALSPEGGRIVVAIRTDASEDIWLKDVHSGTLTRLTFEGRNTRPRWSADGRSVLYSSVHQGGNADLRSRRADGTGEESTLLDLARPIINAELTQDTARLIIRLGVPPTRDILLFTRGEDSARALMASDRFEEVAPALSPDGRWLAYVSDESGRREVYVRPYPDVNAQRWQLSRNGGTEPGWAHSGRELFFRDGAGAFIAVPVQRGASFVPGAPSVLFSTTPFNADWTQRVYSVAPGDARFLFVRNVGVPAADAPSALVRVDNWFAELYAPAAQRRP